MGLACDPAVPSALVFTEAPERTVTGPRGSEEHGCGDSEGGEDMILTFSAEPTALCYSGN